MLRKYGCLVVIGTLLASVPLSAQGAAPVRPKTRSTTSRILWTVAGIGAGFAAGVMIGLNAFDDSVNSDRKVWTTAIVGAVGGGLVGNLIARSVGNSTTVGSPRPNPRLPVARPLVGIALDNDETISVSELRRRVREASPLSTPAPHP